MDQDLIRLQDHLAVFRRRWRLIAMCVVLAIGASLALTLSQTKMYSGTATLLLQPQQSLDTMTTNNTSGVVMEPEEVATQADVIASVQVAERVVDDLGLDVSEPQDLLDDITVTVVEDKRVVEVSALEAKPQLAADVANSFAEQYIDYVEERSTDYAATVQDQINDTLETIDLQLENVDTLLDDATGPERQELQARKDGLQFEQSNLETQLTSLAASQATPLPGGEVLLQAEEPTSPAEPKPVRSVLLGLVLGLLVGVGLAYVRDRLDDAVRDEQRLRSAIGGRPILGSIPNSDTEASGRVGTLIAPQSPLSEAYRALNTNTRFLLAAGSKRDADRGAVMLVTSAGPGEGKTSVATNLAVAAARIGLRVVVVDADLRRPAAAERFGLDVPVGLSDLLAAGGPAYPHLHEVGLDDLRVLASGSIPPNPAELLASPLMAGIVDDLARHVDLVIIDSAPVLRVADSLELIDQADLLLLVARRKVSRMHSLSAAAERIRQVGGNLSGCVFNGVDARDTSYGYGYPPRPGDKVRGGRRAQRGDSVDEQVAASARRSASS
ncbi:MAG TPA: polysaccharide biosynthesis tyrosine autokinase [Nocardioidaceae bacterium]|nr:polysaccharide biosynthesis tyrosine autokinase [Nocardioidaceae bacterium]